MTNDKPRLNGIDFIREMERDDDEMITNKDRKERIFNALFDVLGSDYKPEEIPAYDVDVSINVQSVFAKLRINNYEKRVNKIMSAKEREMLECGRPSAADYAHLAMQAYLKCGGKVRNFKTEMLAYHNKYEKQCQPVIGKTVQNTEMRPFLKNKRDYGNVS